MSIRGSNFENQHPFASDHALVWERCIPDGLLYGVDMSFTPTLFTLGTGFMLVAGRMFEITAPENISISPGSGYARVYVAIDTGGTATENSFDQVSFGVDYAATLDDFTELTQDEININQGAAVYQAEVAVLSIDSTGATAIERQMEIVSPGAGAGAFAAIAVTYPAGATVTVTDGKITYTAPNTSGAALFIIPYAATWIVTATDGTDTASQTVEITTEGQSVSVELSYRLYLYKNGDQCVDVTGGWAGTAPSGGSAVNFLEDSIEITSIKSSGRGAWAYPVNKINFDGTYSELCMEYTAASVADYYWFGLYNDVTTNNSAGYVAGIKIPAETEKKLLVLDISGVTTGEYYVRIWGGSSTSYIYNVWLE